MPPSPTEARRIAAAAAGFFINTVVFAASAYAGSFYDKIPTVARVLWKNCCQNQMRVQGACASMKLQVSVAFEQAQQAHRHRLEIVRLTHASPVEVWVTRIGHE